MPANLTPQYLKAEQWYKSATTVEEKILALEEMLRVIPRHKGTEHMRADLRRKLSSLKDSGGKKAAGGHVDVFHIPRGGAGQIALLGLPNSGKSSIVGLFTNAKVTIAEFPFSTGAPVPGMMYHEDVPIQLVDLPPYTPEFLMPGQIGTYRHCDLIAIVVDLSNEPEMQLTTCMEFLESRKLLLDAATPAVDDQGNALGRKVFCIATKSDLAEAGAVEQLRASCGYPMEYVPFSAASGEGLDELPAACFRLLGIVRVYAKRPHEEPDMKEPFTLPVGSTVTDLARVIHRQLAENLKSARIWGTGVHDGQNVQLTHVLHDKDIIELHFA
ncbi:MAG TPA: TGS domain-containing protein [Phycisphaerales bacterium]|nr:TGS domain-containing protein [Phycisphaerales bacterium]